MKIGLHCRGEDIARDSSFWQYKVYRNIPGGSLDRGRKTTVGLSKMAIFTTFARYFFRSFRCKVKIII